MNQNPPIKDLDIQNKNIIFDKSKIFNIKSNEKNFKLKISHNNELLFIEIEQDGELPKKEYNNLFTLNTLGKINKFFIQFDTLEEVFIFLDELIQNKKLSITEENKQIKIQITNPTTKKIFYIDIPLKNEDMQKEINSLNNKIDKLEKNLDEKNKEINLLKKNNEELNEKIKELMIFKNKAENIKNITPEKKLFFFDSDIIKLEEEADTIINWLPRKPNNLKRLFIPGDTIDAFVNTCAKKYPIIILIKTKKNYRFGGFTTNVWTHGAYEKDNQAFLFSINRKEKYNIINENYATYLENGNYFQFGNGDLRIYNNWTSSQFNCISNNTFANLPANGINGGEQFFTVASLEAYQIEY